MNVLISEVLSSKYCARCFLFKSKEHITVRDETIKMNARHVPEKITILFVAESPPWSFAKDKTAYFYAPAERIPYGGLAYYMIPVLFRQQFCEKEQFLREFMKRGFHLIDMVKCPINKLKKKAKRRKRLNLVQNT